METVLYAVYQRKAMIINNSYVEYLDYSFSEQKVDKSECYAVATIRGDEEYIRGYAEWALCDLEKNLFNYVDER
jgi:hypothetical protein